MSGIKKQQPEQQKNTKKLPFFFVLNNPNTMFGHL